MSEDARIRIHDKHFTKDDQERMDFCYRYNLYFALVAETRGIEHAVSMLMTNITAIFSSLTLELRKPVADCIAKLLNEIGENQFEDLNDLKDFIIDNFNAEENEDKSNS